LMRATNVGASSPVALVVRASAAVGMESYQRP
jgi:hypothetical protein